ncbi:MAG: peptidoglycan-binding protein [Oscillospiraceae bacterium]|nr:peptidoglycan-binding protein [Oscillospiraceae bacterium]
MGKGKLKVTLYLGDEARPVGNVKVLIKNPVSGDTLYELTADENGVTPSVELDAPDRENSLDPYGSMPRSGRYDVHVPPQKGYKHVIVHGVDIFDGETSILPVQMHPAIEGDTRAENTDEYFIPEKHGADEDNGRGQPRRNTARGRAPLPDPPETAPLTAAAGFAVPAASITANDVAIPTHITVHLGSPNAYARNVRVPFADYIKNVASSEIFPTWNEAALYANIYAIISFALNRMFTVWYRSRGFDFDITNNTAFDQFFVEGRNIFENISRIVDRIFNEFLRRPGRREPFFSQYCSGTTVTCRGMSQWGSQDLAVRGYTPIQILRYYYPSDIDIVESNNFTSNTGTYPGAPLREGSTGDDVRLMQTYLNRISGNFYIPSVGVPDGVFGSSTKNAVIAFQRINNLVPDGIIGRSTWYAITKIYVGVKQLAELDSEGERIGIGRTPPTAVVSTGARGEYVVELQFLLNYISAYFPSVPFVVEDGVFRDATKRAVTEFQKEFGLTPDGVVGPATWNKLYDVYWSIHGTVPPAPEPPAPPVQPEFPGIPLRIGSSGEDVRLMQTYLNAISRVFPSIPTLTADGVFGPMTQNSVMAFQWLFGLQPDGVIGPLTWNRIASVYGNLPAAAAPQFPGTLIRTGSRGSDVTLMQQYLNTIAQSYPSIPALSADGIFGPMTERSVMAFQNLFGLSPDGIIGPLTWNLIVSVHNRVTM